MYDWPLKYYGKISEMMRCCDNLYNLALFTSTQKELELRTQRAKHKLLIECDRIDIDRIEDADQNSLLWNTTGNKTENDINNYNKNQND